MKRILAIVMSMVVILGLAGCAKKPNEKFSDNAVAGIKKAIEIVDDYLAYEISYKEANEKLKDIADRIRNSEYEDDSMAAIQISNIAISISLANIGQTPTSDDINKIKRERDELYDSLYK